MINPREFARVLGSGCGGNEHSPVAAARLIDRLAHENETLTARIAEMEHLLMNERTQGQLRDSYARGFRACQAALAETVPPGSAAENQILSIEPDFAKAGRVAQMANS